MNKSKASMSSLCQMCEMKNLISYDSSLGNSNFFFPNRIVSHTKYAMRRLISSARSFASRAF